MVDNLSDYVLLGIPTVNGALPYRIVAEHQIIEGIYNKALKDKPKK